MIIEQKWWYESRFAVIISSQPYWNYHGFLSALGELSSFSVPERAEKIGGLLFAGGMSTQTDTMIMFEHKTQS